MLILLIQIPIFTLDFSNVQSPSLSQTNQNHPPDPNRRQLDKDNIHLDYKITFVIK